MRTFAGQRPIAAYLVVAYLIAAAAFAVPLLSSAGLGLIAIDLPGAAPFILLTAVGLAAAAFFVTALEGKTGGVRELRSRVFHLRVNPLWYLLALALLPAAALVTAIAASGPAPLERLLQRPSLLATEVALAALVAFLLVNWWEEAGWTGFVLHRLQPRIGPLRASALTTWLQAFIHLPLVFIADGVTVGRVPAGEVPFYLVALFVLPIPVRLIITWLYNASGWSVPVVGLFHAGLGVATGGAFIPVLAPNFAMVWVYAGFALVAAALVVATRGSLGYHEIAPKATRVGVPGERPAVG